MYPYSRIRFDPERTLYVRRPFLWDGTELVVGDEFPSSSAGIGRIQELWSLHAIDHESPVPRVDACGSDGIEPVTAELVEAVDSPARGKQTLPPNPTLRPPKRR